MRLVGGIVVCINSSTTTYGYDWRQQCHPLCDTLAMSTTNRYVYIFVSSSTTDPAMLIKKVCVANILEDQVRGRRGNPGSRNAIQRGGNGDGGVVMLGMLGLGW